MTTKNTYKTLQKKTQSIKRSIASFALFHPLVKNKRAVSAVISNIILIGAVMAVGLVALGYARSTAINYQADYSETMNNDINKIKESLTFEYAHYSSNQLSLYIINSGPINVTIKSISINSSPVSSLAWTIYPINGAQPLSQSLPIAKGTEVRIVVSTTGISLPIGENSVKIISGSDSNFAYNFLV
jgi:hypothetical protein